MRSTLSRTEGALLWACLALLALAVLGPPLQQPPHAHEFADRRTLLGVPFALDVLSNLALALAGGAGLRRLATLPPRTLSNMQRAMAGLFFVGLPLTGAASAWYHWHPDDAGLALERCGMAVALGGMLGLAAADRVSERAAAALGLAALLLGAAAVRAWTTTGNVAPWTVLQFGGIALLLWLAVRAGAACLDVRWSLVVLAYTTAKLLELNDREIFRLTGELVSGHTLRHVVAAFTAWPVLAAIAAAGAPGRELARRRKASRKQLGEQRHVSAMRRSRP